VCAIKAPGFGDRRKAMLQDIAVLTGGQLISEEVGLDAVSLDMMGVARKVTIDKESTTIVAGGETKADVRELVKSVASWKRPTLTTTKKTSRADRQTRRWSCGESGCGD